MHVTHSSKGGRALHFDRLTKSLIIVVTGDDDDYDDDDFQDV